MASEKRGKRSTERRARNRASGAQPAAREYEWVDPRSLRVWAGNPKTYTELEVEELAQSVRRFGWGRPLVANRHKGLEGEIIGGHRSQLVGLKLLDSAPPGAPGPGLVPVVWRDLPAKQAHALALADTRVPKTELDSGKMQVLARGHELDAADWQAAGFAEREVRALLFDPWPELSKPGKGGDGIEQKFQVVIDCSTEAQQTQIIEWAQEQKLKCRALI